MSKENFIDELRIKLKRLSKEEVDNVVAYYLEYFDDAEKDEAEVIKELGSPSTIASQILSDYAFNTNTKEKSKSGINRVLLIILSIFAAPIALPLAIALIVIIFAMIIVVGALIFTFAAVALTLLLAGVVAFIVGFLVIFQGPATGSLYIGTGLIVIGLGILVAVGVKAIVPKVAILFRNITKSFLSKVNRSKNK
ncbi:DUF1700 domain-containing protein [Clostridium sp. MB05]|uniref:DUF1700 domain-containing protein n=2 Tax=Clostridium TaxID=1485 RepID=UPI0039819650